MALAPAVLVLGLTEMAKGISDSACVLICDRACVYIIPGTQQRRKW